VPGGDAKRNAGQAIEEKVLFCEQDADRKQAPCDPQEDA
jgi:hypothetical protein